MNKIIAGLLVFLLFSSSGVAINSVASGPTVVKVDPSLIEYHEDATDQQFTVAIKIVDVTNLFGFDIKFRWNTTFLDYVSHSVRIPKNTYADGVLWNPVLIIMDEVNITAGTYWIAYSSRWPAPSFNGSGTVFTMTLRVKYHPTQPEPNANIKLELYSIDLSDKGGSPIPHTRQDGTVILYALLGHHDIAITSVIPWKTVVGQELTCKINVTVTNQGSFIETFNVTVYANTTVIATIANIALANASSTTVILMWDTIGFTKGNYAIIANATTVPGETDTADNTYTDGIVTIAIIGDVNADGVIDIFDIAYVAISFGSEYGKPPPPETQPYNPNADLNSDNIIDIFDIATIAINFGKTDP